MWLLTVMKIKVFKITFLTRSLYGYYVDNAEALYDEYIEQLSEINEEDPPEAEEEEEEETEIEAVERMKTSIIEHFEEQNESISLLQVIAFS